MLVCNFSNRNAKGIMVAWDPTQYLKFGSERLRPALDLLARVPLDAPASVVDLGCGAGNVTQWLRRRWPDVATRITGVDASPEMLERARKAEASAQWVQADIAGWQPDGLVDLIFSNAALHWLPGHAGLFARLFGFLRPGGVLAVQMPNQTHAPSHQAIGEVIDAGPWRADLKQDLHARRLKPIAAHADYYDWLIPHAQRIDQWETLYTHVLQGAPSGSNAVAEWTQSTSLLPVMSAFDAAGQAWFWADYCRRMHEAYPRRADGTTLFPFRRFFLVAVRNGAGA